MATRIQFRRGTDAEWTSSNPILAEGELGLELDTGRFKVGVGTTSWTNLEYAFGTIDELNVTGIGTVGSLSIGSTQVISSARQLQNIVSLDAITTATIESAVAAAPNDFTSLNISGISTLNGLVDINNDVDISGNLKVVGISTLNNVVVGGATTALIVSGNARIIGILTIGTSSITLNGFNNQVNVGSATTITADGFQVGENTLHSTGLTVNNINSTGIITANSFSGTVTGTATSTTNIPNLTGDITSVNTATTLATVNSNVGSFGSQTLIPIVTVNAKGLVTAVTTAAVGTALTVTGDSGSENIDLLTETLSISGGTNLTSSVASNAVTVNLDPNISLTSVFASGIVTATSGFVGNLTGEVNAAAFDTNASGVVITGVTTSSSGFVGNLTGLASSATQLATGRTVAITGDLAYTSGSFDGTGNVTGTGTLSTVNSNVGSFGSQTLIPVVTVNAKGLVTAVTTAAVGTALTVTGDSGSENINLLTETLSISGGTNLTSSAASNTVTVNLDPNISLTSVVASGIVTATSGFSGDVSGNVTGNINSSGVSTFTSLISTNINASGIVTATQFVTGASGSAIGINTNTISGPATITIDPAGVGDNTGAVRIKGDLFVDGTQFIVNSTTIELADFVVGIASTATTDILADGAGIKIGPDNTLTYDHTNTALKSSENFNLASGKTYKINGTNVLSATTLGSAVVNSSLTSLGTITNGTITNLTGTAGTITTFNSTNGIITNLTGTAGTITTFDSTVGTITNLTSTNVNVSGISTLGVTSTTNLTSQQLNVSGITTLGVTSVSSLIGYSALVGTASSTTKTFVVTVASKTSNHRYFGTGSANAYFIDSIESPFLTLLPGKTYRFNQESNTNGPHPILFYYQADKTTQYTTNVTTTGTPGSAGAYTEIVVTDTTPVVLHYQCSVHDYMGNAAHFSSNVVDTPYDIIARSGISVSGISTLGVTSTTNLTSQELNVSGISTLGVTSTTNLTSQELNVSGISTLGVTSVSSLRGYNSLVGTASSSTTTFVVTIASKTSNHRYFGSGSANAYFIDDIESPFLTLLPGKTYLFNQEDGTNSSHPVLFYYQADKTTQYTTNVTTTGTPGSAGAYTEIVVTDTTPVVLHYQCSVHDYMGNAAQFNSNVVDTPYDIIARSNINVTGVVTATNFIGAISGTASSTSNIPNLTGAITSDNTTTSLGSFSSSDLSTALSDKTGTGVNVFATSPTLVTPVLGAASATSIVVSSGSTFTNGPILVGSATSTGTESQRLQVTGGAYVSGNLGIGVTAPSFKADIAGDARITSTNKMRFGGTAGTTNFFIRYNSTTNSLDFVAG